LDRVELEAVVAQAPGQGDGDVGDALRVAAGVVVLRLHRARECADRLDELLSDLFDAPRALDRGRELGEDRAAEAVPALALELRRLIDVQTADPGPAGDEVDAALALAELDPRRGP